MNATNTPDQAGANPVAECLQAAARYRRNRLHGLWIVPLALIMLYLICRTFSLNVYEGLPIGMALVIIALLLLLGWSEACDDSRNERIIRYGRLFRHEGGLDAVPRLAMMFRHDREALVEACVLCLVQDENMKRKDARKLVERRMPL